MSEIKLCVFDMDGLMLDTERQMWLVHEEIALNELGYKADVNLLCKQMGGSWQSYNENMKKWYGEDFPIEKVRKRIGELNKIYIEKGYMPTMKGLIELLDYLKANNIKMAVGTSTHRDQAIACLKAAHIYEYFDNIICGDEVTKSKPDPQIYTKSYEHFGIDKENVLIFEDGHNGARSAIASGARLVLVPDLAFLTDEDKKEAFAVLNNLAEAIDIIKKENERTTSI